MRVKKLLEYILPALISILFLSPVARSFFSDKNTGTSGGQFLAMPKGVRASGMGEAQGAVSGDINAIYFNPAALNSMESPAISAMHSLWLNQMYYEYVTGALPLDIGVFAFSLNYKGMPDIQKTDKTGITLDEKYGAYDILTYLSYAGNFREHNYGANLFMIRESIDDESATAFGIDLGYITELNSQASVGLSLQNIGTNLKFRDKSYPLPFNLKAGVSYMPAEELLIAADVNLGRDNIPALNAGSEYTYELDDISLKARTGYRTQPAFTYGALYGFSFGGGIEYSSFVLDYAWSPYGKLGSAHRFALSYTFPTARVVTPPEEEEPFIFPIEQRPMYD